MSAETIRSCPMCGHDNRTLSASPYSREHWRIKACAACRFVYLENAASYEDLVSEFAWTKTKVDERERKIGQEPVLLKAERRLRRLRRRWRARRNRCRRARPSRRRRSRRRRRRWRRWRR